MLSQEPLGYGIKGWEDIKRGSQILKQDFRIFTGTNLKIALHKTEITQPKVGYFIQIAKEFYFSHRQSLPQIHLTDHVHLNV